MSLDQVDYERLVEIQKEMQSLVEEAKNLVRMSGNRPEYDRAKAYWLTYIENALDDAKSPLMMCTMGDTIRALEPEEEMDEDDEGDVEEEDSEIEPYSPFERNPQDTLITEEDAKYLQGEPVPLKILVPVKIKEQNMKCPMCKEKTEHLATGKGKLDYILACASCPWQVASHALEAWIIRFKR